MDLRLHFTGCKYLDNKGGYIDCTQLEKLYNYGHDIGSHSIIHENPGGSSINNLQSDSSSKACKETWN